MGYIYSKLFLYLVMILSANLHEYAHGFVANELGDPTAKDAGRLTLNPLAHIDLIGTVIFPLILLFSGSGFIVGWSKPVPYNPFNLRDKKYGSLKVAIAGPATNIFIAVVLGIILRLSFAGIWIFANLSPLFLEAISLIVYVNILWAIFNLIPVPPLDGSKVLMDLFPKTGFAMMNFGFLGIFLALGLAFVVLPPITQFFYFILVGRPIM